MSSSPRRRRGGTAAPSLAAGVLLALSLPPWGWWPLGLAGAGLLYWRLAGLRARARLWSGWVAGLGCYAPGLWWARTFNWYGAVVLIALEALFFAVAALLTPPYRGRAPAFVAAGTLAEAIRMTWPFGGLPLGGVFLGQADGPLLQLARIGGPLLLTAGVWAGGVGLATLVCGIRHRGAGRCRPSGGRPSWSPSPSASSSPRCPPTAGRRCAPSRSPSYRAVGGEGSTRRRSHRPRSSPRRWQRPASVGTVTPPPTLVLWPEDVIALAGPLRGSSQSRQMSQMARRLHTTLAAGVTEPASATTFRNEIVVWAPDGRIVGTFEKVHRVPFGEYVPYRSLIAHVADLSGVPLDAVPGHGTGLLRTPAGPLGILVSFEVFYADRSHTSVREGAELLIVPTNTSSYTTAQVPTQEVAADAVQAVETGRDLVQSAPTGYSTVVDHRGQVRQRSVLGRRQVLTATVALRRGLTPYDHWGDLPVLLLAAAALLAGWWRQRVTRSSPNGCRRRGSRRPRTWRDWRDRPRRPVADRIRGPEGPRPPPS